MENQTQPRSNGSAITYARRYSVLLAFGLATTDNDGENLTAHIKISSAMATALITAIRNKNYTKAYVDDVLSKYGVSRVEDLAAVDLPNFKKDLEV